MRRLTLRESRVARLVAEGHSDAEIAKRLDASVADVGDELGAVFRKLGLRSRTELALFVPASDEGGGRVPDPRGGET